MVAVNRKVIVHIFLIVIIFTKTTWVHKEPRLKELSIRLIKVNDD